MGKNNNTIQINGQTYDAKTGAKLSHGPKHNPGAHKRSVDGVITKAKPPIKPVTPPASKPAHHDNTRRPSMHDVARKPGKRAHPHHQQSSETLMRTAVKKPSQSLKRRVAATSHAGAITKQPKLAVIAKPSVGNLDEQRLKHAKQVKKSNLIVRFNNSFPSVNPASYFQPTEQTQPTIPAIPATNHKSTKRQGKSKPKTTAELLEHALQHATSHEQPKPSKKSVKKRRFGIRRRSSGLSAIIFAVIVFTAFVGYQNVNNLKLKIASSKAGFSATLPTYQAPGYHLDRLTYEHGLVALRYQSNSDQRYYAITERSSAWDSQALKENVVIPAGRSYQTVQTAGQTMYVVGEDKAAWVNGGVWYQVEGNVMINNHQLGKLVASL